MPLRMISGNSDDNPKVTIIYFLFPQLPPHRCTYGAEEVHLDLHGIIERTETRTVNTGGKVRQFPGESGDGENARCVGLIAGSGKGAPERAPKRHSEMIEVPIRVIAGGENQE